MSGQHISGLVQIYCTFVFANYLIQTYSWNLFGLFFLSLFHNPFSHFQEKFAPKQMSTCCCCVNALLGHFSIKLILNMVIFLCRVAYPFQQDKYHIKVMDSLGISLHSHSKINIQMCVKHQVSICICYRKGHHFTANGANGALVNPNPNF